jgi:membrane fusion protein YbhG
MDRSRLRVIPIVLIVIIVAVAAWYFLQQRNSQNNSTLQGSGTVEAVETIVASELAGRVSEVMVSEGDLVEAGQELFHLDGEALQAQHARLTAAMDAALAGQRAAEQALGSAQSGVQQAQAGVNAAQAALESAHLQHQQVVDAARLADLPRRTTAWAATTPSEFDLPVWYFSQDEEIAAAQAEVEAASQALKNAETDFQTVLKDEGGEDLAQAEERLAQAQIAFAIADQVLEQARDARDRTDLEDKAQDLFDSAEDELNEAQADFDLLISEISADQLRQARASLMIAQERYATALDELSRRQTGDHSLEVRLAELAVRQTEASLTQVQAGLDQAHMGVSSAETQRDQANALVAQTQADIHSLDIQLEKLFVRAPTAGVILTRSIEPGEVIQPGGTTMTLGRLDDLTITVYLPEDRYGQVQLGDRAQVVVDSYPDRRFDAVVTRVADQAEYTPRNVQTEEGRRTTVYAVELSVSDTQGMLKPGMPADVSFEE